MKNLSKRYEEEYSAIFNIILFTSIFLIAALISTAGNKGLNNLEYIRALCNYRFLLSVHLYVGSRSRFHYLSYDHTAYQERKLEWLLLLFHFYTFLVCNITVNVLLCKLVSFFFVSCSCLFDPNRDQFFSCSADCVRHFFSFRPKLLKKTSKKNKQIKLMETKIVKDWRMEYLPLIFITMECGRYTSS